MMQLGEGFFCILVWIFVVFGRVNSEVFSANEILGVCSMNCTPSKDLDNVSAGSKERKLISESHLEGFSILFGLSRVANENLVAEACFKELKQIQRGILLKKPWAMKVLDASASNAAGFTFQHNFWLGSRETCAAANEPLRITLNRSIRRSEKPGLVKEVAPFHVEFSVAYLRHHSPWQMQVTLMTQPLLHVGLCLPASCSSTEIHQLMRQLMERRSFTPADLYEFRGEVLYVKDLKLKEEFYHKQSLKILVALVLITAGAMIFCGFHSESLVEKDKSKLMSNVDRPSSVLTRIFIEFVECFDLERNCRKMFSTSGSNSINKHNDNIPAINGLRSLAAFGILFMHSTFYSLHTMQNLPHLLSQLETKAGQLQNLSVYLVDAFFTISGFLQTFHFLKDEKEMQTIRRNAFKQNLQRFLINLLQRYFRLAPLYLVSVVVVDLLTAYINDVSLFHIYDRYNEVCPMFWWRHLLLIQSYFAHDELCLSWSWSLSCEMQFFILASVLLFSYAKHPKFAKCCVVALLAANVTWSLLRGTTQKFQFDFETSYRTLDALYIDPSVRVIPYLVGAVAAWFLVMFSNDLDINISSALERVLWLLAAALFLGSGFTMFWRDLSYLPSISMYLLGRLMMSLAVCWIVVASAMGRRCCWSRILEAGVFQHVNRLTYAIYLLNPVIITAFAGLSGSSAQADIGSQIVNFCGYGVIVYLVSIIFSLAFEVPYSNWSARLKQRYKQKIL